MSTNLLLRAWFLARAGRFRLQQVRPRDAPEVRVDGPDPVRVLVTGAGLAAGYGVATHDASLAGRLARRVADGTGRGASVHVDAAPLLPAHAAIGHIGADGARSFQVAVFAPCFLEGTFTPGSGLARHGARIQQHLLDTGGPDLRLMVVGIPRPGRFSRLDLAAARAADRANATMRTNAADDPRVRWVSPPELTSVTDESPFDQQYYARLADRIADQLLPALGHPLPASAAHPPR